MVSRKIIMYISVPGLALIYGIYLYRRRKSDDNLKKLSNGKISKHNQNQQQLKNSSSKFNIDNDDDEEKLNGVDGGKSVNIAKKMNSPTENSELCRSAPISIYSNNNLLNGIKPLDHINDEDEDNDNFIISASSCSFTPSTVRLPGTPRKLTATRRCNINDSKTEVVKASPIFKMSNFDESSLIVDEYNNNNCNDYDDCSTNSSSTINNNNSNNNRKCLLSNSTSSPDYNYQSSLESPSISSSDKNIKYEFLLPNKFIGKFYGKNKKNLNRIKSQTGTSIIIKKHTFCDDYKVCVITGSQSEVYSALTLIRKILPKKQFPNLTLKRISALTTDQIVQLPPENYLQLNLVEGINNDVTVVTVTAESDLLTLFVQQPLHPSHPFLSVLQSYLCCIYNEINAPYLPQLKENAICVGRINNNWYRLQIVQVFRGFCFAKFVDHGGFTQIYNEDLRQIRQDLLSIPFQAIDCCLSNLRPIGDAWGVDVPAMILTLTNNMILQAQVVGYTEDNIPEIYLFAVLGGKRILFINKELVAREVAVWID
ncbi:A-kinase anchor protein 1, mitochondrial [Condylostylus longicornis]|uniref:A-kinase anchor protein 1, mitochondrial n=1 Tax=Condylostylus longicornis TaxID=2530218 RepID=UPI00244E27AF|nr:A-kinase anchor protein 1, mitochondrial [Condylostylus longicornis]